MRLMLVNMQQFKGMMPKKMPPPSRETAESDGAGGGCVVLL